jgi:hypothetical protein
VAEVEPREEANFGRRILGLLASLSAYDHGFCLATLFRPKPARSHRKTVRKPAAGPKKSMKVELTAEEIALENAILAAAARDVAGLR